MSERITISIDENLKSQLEAVANKADISVSNIVRRCITLSLNNVAEKFEVKISKEEASA